MIVFNTSIYDELKTANLAFHEGGSDATIVYNNMVTSGGEVLVRKELPDFEAGGGSARQN